MPVVVAFISQKGGVGKSTLARALAAVAVQGGLKVMVADIDPGQRTLMQWQQARKDSKISPAIVVQAFSDVDKAVTAACGCDLLIIDTPGSVNRGTLRVAQHAHLVVQPTGTTLDDLHPTVLVFHELVNAGISKSRLVGAVCRVLTREEEQAARAYLSDAGYETLPGSIPERAAYRAAQNRGRALTETTEKVLNRRVDALMEGLLLRVAEQLEHARSAEKKGKRHER